MSTFEQFKNTTYPALLNIIKLQNEVIMELNYKINLIIIIMTLICVIFIIIILFRAFNKFLKIEIKRIGKKDE